MQPLDKGTREMLIHSHIKMKHRRGVAPSLSSVLKFHIHPKEEINRIRQAGFCGAIPI